MAKSISSAEPNGVTLEQQRKKLKRRKMFIQFLPLYVMLLPGLLYLILNNYLPMAGLLIAFKKIDYSLGIFKSPWVKFDNFKYLFSNADVAKAAAQKRMQLAKMIL